MHGWGEEKAQGMLNTCRPLGVAVYDLLDKETLLKGWEESKPSGYKGMHGIKIPVWGVDAK